MFDKVADLWRCYDFSYILHVINDRIIHFAGEHGMCTYDGHFVSIFKRLNLCKSISWFPACVCVFVCV